MNPAVSAEAHNHHNWKPRWSRALFLQGSRAVGRYEDGKRGEPSGVFRGCCSHQQPTCSRPCLHSFSSGAKVKLLLLGPGSSPFAGSPCSRAGSPSSHSGGFQRPCAQQRENQLLLLLPCIWFPRGWVGPGKEQRSLYIPLLSFMKPSGDVRQPALFQALIPSLTPAKSPSTHPQISSLLSRYCISMNTHETNPLNSRYTFS